MVDSKKVEKKKHVAVYYTPSEIKQITKKANQKLDGVSPYLRKVTLEALGMIPAEA
jgi:hypothetical protein